LFVARGAKNYAVLISENLERVVYAPQFYVMKVSDPALLPAFLVWQINQKPMQIAFGKMAEGTATKSIRRSVLIA
jgi:hypothetical protein